jgi:hypothetical protein
MFPGAVWCTNGNVGVKMGGIVIRSHTIHELTGKVNSRFAAGDSIQEMATIQKDFKIFSPGKTLQQAYRALQIVPNDPREKRLWYRYLEYTKSMPSDQAGVTGHDRIIKARQENLESSKALPMFTKVHAESVDPRVTVTRGRPTPHDADEHIIISMPVRAPGEAAPPPRPSTAKAPTRTSRKKRAN